METEHPTNLSNPPRVPGRRPWLRRAARWSGVWLGRALLALLILLASGFGYGIPASDVRQMLAFRAAADRWQVNPDYRRVCDEYVRLSHATLQARMAGISSADVLMCLRSVPFLPTEYAANDGSREHYETFTVGDLSAYIHLCKEQNTHYFVEPLEALGGRLKQGQLTDDDLRHFIDSFDFKTNNVKDAGALAGVRRLIEDTGASPDHPLSYRTGQEDRLLAAIAAMARDRGYPPELPRMSDRQQADLMNDFDATLRRTDFELWRIKQLTDFSAGIWGHVYGRVYKGFLGGILTAHEICRFAAPALWALTGVWLYRRHQRKSAERARVREAEAFGVGMAGA